ncbi:hypothetical protein GALL_348560 [mine drainage metagenome]|uniref:Uncharacterized protein n=1 Tax=mine drainage metagenome TaxID=410659 RepID=A0A1J5R0T9_9ZZZZ
MDIPNIRTTGSPATPGLNPPTTQAGGASPQGAAIQAAALTPQGGQGTSTGATGSSGAPAAASGAPASGAPASQEKALQQAVAKLNKQLDQQSAGITLSAGLDTSGTHPGQVLVELSDKQTKQTFYKYYLPPQNVIQAADQAGGSSTAGVLLNTKA